MVRAGLVEVGPALFAKPGAVLPAQHPLRHRQRDRIACPGSEIEHALLDVGAEQLGVVLRDLLDLAGVDVERLARPPEATPAGSLDLDVEAKSQRISGGRP